MGQCESIISILLLKNQFGTFMKSPARPLTLRHFDVPLFSLRKLGWFWVYGFLTLLSMGFRSIGNIYGNPWRSPNDSLAYRFQGSNFDPLRIHTHTHSHLTVPYFISLFLLADVNEIQKCVNCTLGKSLPTCHRSKQPNEDIFITHFRPDKLDALLPLSESSSSRQR